MNKKLIIRLSNNIGNQMFMYAAAYAFAKKINAELLIDEETSFNYKNNLYKYSLDGFSLTSKLAPRSLKFLNLSGYLKRKFLKKINNIISKKNFYIEKQNKEKMSYFNDDFLKKNYNTNIFVEGYFQSEKYFSNFKNDIFGEFAFKSKNDYMNNPYFKMIKNSNSISICIRQNRFSEKQRKLNKKDYEKSKIFTEDQIKYVKKCMDIIKTKINRPKFFLWSNDNTNLVNYFPDDDVTAINNDKYVPEIHTNHLDLFLMTQTKHFIVTPSSFNWWGCWLSDNNNKIILRPSDQNFTNFKVNNKDFWPMGWVPID